MKPEKYLKKAAKAEQQQILENGGELLARLETQVPQKKKKRRAAVWLSVAATSLALVIAAVCVGVFAFREEEILYYEDNIVNVACDQDELNRACREFAIDTTGLRVCDVIKSYDSPSGDVLYFSIILQKDKFLAITISIVCNPRYHYRRDIYYSLPLHPTEAPPLRYSLRIQPSNGYYLLSGMGMIEGKQEKVYITDFLEISDRPTEEPFFETVHKIICKK